MNPSPSPSSPSFRLSAAGIHPRGVGPLTLVFGLRFQIIEGRRPRGKQLAPIKGRGCVSLEELHAIRCDGRPGVLGHLPT